MSRTASPSTHKRYPVVRICRVWVVGRSTVYGRRPLKATPEGAPVRPGPMGPCRDHDLLQHNKAILAETPFNGEGYRQVWARLRYAGLRT